MTHFPRPHASRRSPRVQLGANVPAAIRRDDGKRTRAKLQTISVTGGLLEIAGAFEEGDFVEIAFQTRSGPVQGMAEMLYPRSAADGWVQPFRFIALEDEDHQKLRMALESVRDRTFVTVRSASLRAIPAL